ncbi:MAG: hypothetical protein HYY11_10405 [Candidatus Methylomirabilis oxyfera]|nr:hypothetical protein [Candidatus Methylomirabilis oxyfera]
MRRILGSGVGVWVTLFALSMVLSVRPAESATRGRSGLPPGPGNPIAAVQAQINALDARLDAIEAAGNAPATMWIEHLDFLSGDPADLTTSFRSTSSGVGGGLAGLIITSSSTGDVFPLGGNKVVEKAIQVPPRFTVTGVRLCYEWSAGATSNITQIRLAQVQDPPSTANVLLDDATVQPNVGPVCIDSAATSVDPSLGAVLLSLRLNIGNISDTLVLRSVALHLTPSAP